MAIVVPPVRNGGRIPNIPGGAIVDAQGKPTAEELFFRQALLTLLQKLMGEEGLVMPQQDAANVLTIAAHKQENPGTAAPGSTYICAFGTMIYQPSTAIYPAAPNDLFLVAMNDGTVNQAPKFKTVTVT